MDKYELNEPTFHTFRISDLDDSDKPREKALHQGIQSLSNAELLAIVLGSGQPGKSVIQLSMEILKDNDHRLTRLSRMTIDEMKNRYKGVGIAKAVSLAAALELGNRFVDEDATADPQIKSSNDIFKLIRHKLITLNYEEFWVLHLNRANKVIYEECLSQGGTVGTVVDIKLLLKSAINKLTSSIILVHNHPSGNIKPSHEDDLLTQRIKNAANIVDIRVLDHIIIGGNNYYSYLDNNKL